ncbi:MAG: cytochrome-c peroxidase [Deltaproteobacteria bacterium]|nr:cytochrome-c peroxidase [Deltaproteobacteria bacterium]
MATSGPLEPVPEVQAPADNPQTTEKIELGKKLFFDRRLSGDGTMSCASCHMPDLGFSDGQDISLSYPTTKNWRNTPTLYNIAFSRALFHDGRSGSLEEQALFPIMSAFEMNQNLDYLEEEIREVPEYRAAFQRVFGDEVNRRNIARALASFQRTIISRNSALDRYLKGDKKALSGEAEKGLGIFLGKGKCAACHNGINLSDDRYYALGVPENPEHLNDPRINITRRFVAKISSNYREYRTLKEDPGRFLVSGERKDWKAFRTPTLREIGKTAPYMHNGIFSTLEEVIEFFNQGGGPGNSTLKPLGLNEQEKRQLLIFMTEALAGEELKIIPPVIP